jgi:aminoglycoside phosphotransferase (APT) family kinase protein
MTCGIADVIAALVPGYISGGPLSVVRVETTRPVFLVFSSDASKPDYVVHVSPSGDAARIHATLATLHPLAGDLVPEPLAVGPWQGGESVQIERGAAGFPWFTISQRLRSESQRLALRSRAVGALRRLHSAIERVPGWRHSVCPADELRRQARSCEERGIALSDAVHAHVDAAVAQLQRLARVTWPWQHGDFCLNNMLIGPTTISIIDFEEFAVTAVPLHDEFALAMSLHALVPVAGRSMADDIEQCLEVELTEHPELRPCTESLFLHHLLLRINLCDSPNRRAMQQKLVAYVEQIADNPRALTLALAS